MRHGKKFNHLGRTKPHREAMLSNMACSLIEHKRINTTIAKAKALRTFVEPLITRSKSDSTHSRRMVFRQLNNKIAVSDLFRDIAPKVADRPGGYTRIIRTGYRLGDNAEMCMIELVDFNDVMLKDTKPGKTRRRRKKSSGSTTPAPEAKTQKEATVAETIEEVVEAKVEEKPAEAPKAEVKAEAKVVKKEEPKAEVKTEAKVEKKETAKKEPKAEVKDKTEAKTEPKAEKKIEESKPKEDKDSDKKE